MYSSQQPSPMNDSTSSPRAKSRRARQWIALAVAISMPVGLSVIAKLHAAEHQPIYAVQQPALSPTDALKEGIRLYRNAQYEESVAMLQSVNADALAEADKRTLYQTLGQADSAASGRKTARAEFELGQQALQANRAGEATTHFYNVVNNRYVDEGTRKKAQEQMAVADAQRKNSSGDMKQTYASAVADYKAGQYGPAKQKFEQLQAQGYKTAMFQRTPEDYLKDISRRQPAAETNTQLVMPGDNTLTPPVAAPPTAVAAAPAAVAAPSAAAAAAPAPAPAPAPEATAVVPVPVPVPVPAPEATAVVPPPAPAPAPEVTAVAPPPAPAPAPEAVAVAPAPAPLPPPAPAPAPVDPGPIPAPLAPPPAPEPVAATPPAPAAPEVTAIPAPLPAPAATAGPTSTDPREAYTKGREQYKSGDWVNARKNFNAAVEGGYKPKLFEDSPQTYLARMDKKEQQDAAKAALAAKPAPAPAPAAAAAPTAVAVVPVPAPAVVPPPAPAPEPAPAVAPAPAPAPEAVALAPAPAPAPAPEVIEPPPLPPAPAPVAPPAPEPAPAPAVAPAPEPAPAPAPAPVVVAPVPVPAPAPEAAPAAPVPAPAPAPAPVAPAPAPYSQPAPAVAAAPTPDQQLAQTAQMQGVVAQDNAAKARQKVEQANAARQANDATTALQLYSEAVVLDPNNQAAVAGKNDMMTLTGRAAAPTSALDRMQQNIAARQQEIQWRFDSNLQQAKEATVKGDFSAAQADINNARVARNADPNIFPEQTINDFETRLTSAQIELNKAQEVALAANASKQQSDTVIAISKAREEAARQRADSVADLRAQAQKLISETRYAEALGVLDQILVLDPNNDYATGLRPLVNDKAMFQQQRRFREDFDMQFVKQLNQSEEKKIPYDDILRYPSNWPDISELRDQTVTAERGGGAADETVGRQLEQTLPEINFNAVTFDEVIKFFQDVTGSNIDPNWPILEAAGIDKSVPITLRLRNVKFGVVLQSVLDQASPTRGAVGYYVSDGIIHITTSEAIGQTAYTRVYDIRDLIIEVPDFNNAPTFNLQSQGTGQTSGQGGGGGGGGGQSLFGGGGNSGSGGLQVQRTRIQLIDEIKKLITDTVAPDSWRDAGGTIGSLQELSGQLIVTQISDNHKKLQGVLEQLRETRAMQITVEARFLTVQRNYLEDIGFDIDVVLNNRDRSANSQWSAIPITQNSVQFTANPSTGVPGSLATTLSPSGGGVGGLGLSSLGLTGTYLDNFTVSFLLRATQAAQSSTLVTAPRLTLFNGQRAFVLVSRQTAYVSDLEPIVAQQAVAFNPTIGLVQSGVLLDVQATVSSDRKYVTLTLRPQLATLLDLLPFTFQSATTAAATQTNNNGGTNFSGTNAASGTVQQPILQITEVRTTVSVPDGGTLLLGGQTLAGETEREAGVPVLSKIPFLKRLFTNRSMAKDEQILLILVKPTIVIQREQEQKQFPMLSTRITQ